MFIADLEKSASTMSVIRNTPTFSVHIAWPKHTLLFNNILRSANKLSRKIVIFTIKSHKNTIWNLMLIKTTPAKMNEVLP